MKSEKSLKSAQLQPCIQSTTRFLSNFLGVSIDQYSILLLAMYIISLSSFQEAYHSALLMEYCNLAVWQKHTIQRC